ncbi:class II aldolase/adducin family protein, partial [Phyllobacterium sp. P5_D12]
MADKVQLLDNRWDDQKAAGVDEPGKLLYRSNLLGADKRITNYGGGNTSAKVIETDPLTGKPVEVLWVKGSGGDVGTIKLDGFATLYMEKLESLKSIYKGVEDEDRMVGFLPHCTFNLNGRAASIDTPLHGFVPFKHVDHMHPDAIIAIAASKNSHELTQEIFGDEIGWLPWRRPGFQLGLDLGAYVAAHPNSKGVVLESHGLFTWANDAKECYELTLDIINKAIIWFDQKTAVKAVFGGEVTKSLGPSERRAIAAKLMPEIRGKIGVSERKLGHFDDQPAV